MRCSVSTEGVTPERRIYFLEFNEGPGFLKRMVFNEDRLQFLIEEALIASRTAACTRARVYRDGVIEEQVPLKRDLDETLKGLATLYRDLTPNLEAHLTNIEELADHLTNEHGSLLIEGGFESVSLQKALNLLLKYLWCLGEVEHPPHCPFDSIVLSEIGKYSDGPPLVPWTQMDSPEEYRRYVAAAECAIAETLYASLAEWELDMGSTHRRR